MFIAPASVLVIDDNKGFRTRAVRGLTSLGCRAQARRHGLDDLDGAPAEGWQAILVGFEPFDDARLEAVRRVRRRSDVPVLLIGADEAAGLEAGADACLPRGCSIRQVFARLQAVTRRAAMAAGAWSRNTELEELAIGDLRILPGPGRAILAGRELSLTPGQFALLHSLAKSCGRIVSRDDLYTEVQDREYRADDRAIDMQVSCLRRKLGDDPKRPRFIRTVRSAGYMLTRPDACQEV